MGALQLQLAFRKDSTWIYLVAGTGIATLLVNLAGLMHNISVALPHLLYIPIVLAGYRFPKKGVVVSASIALAYFCMVLLFSGNNSELIISGISRSCVFVAIGWVVSYLSKNMYEQEMRYRGLFDHSEAGTAVIRKAGEDYLIDEANFRCAEILGTRIRDLEGMSFLSFWTDKNEWTKFTDAFRRDGACYAFETRLVKKNKKPVEVLLSAGKSLPHTYILTVIDITERKIAQDALQQVNANLNFLSGIVRKDLLVYLDGLTAAISKGKAKCSEPKMLALLDSIGNSAHLMQRRLDLTRIYQNLGAEPPAWHYIQDSILNEAQQIKTGSVSIRVWVERLEIYADPLLRDVFHNLLNNAIRHGKKTSEIVVTYQRTGDGISILVEDDGAGIPDTDKETIFTYGSGSNPGLGLFIDRMILGVTGITIAETGTYGSGARFEIRVPPEKSRIL